MIDQVYKLSWANAVNPSLWTHLSQPSSKMWLPHESSPKKKTHQRSPLVYFRKCACSHREQCATPNQSGFRIRISRADPAHRVWEFSQIWTRNWARIAIKVITRDKKAFLVILQMTTRMWSKFRSTILVWCNHFQFLGVRRLCIDFYESQDIQLRTRMVTLRFNRSLGWWRTIVYDIGPPTNGTCLIENHANLWMLNKANLDNIKCEWDQ